MSLLSQSPRKIVSRKYNPPFCPCVHHGRQLCTGSFRTAISAANRCRRNFGRTFVGHIYTFFLHLARLSAPYCCTSLSPAAPRRRSIGCCLVMLWYSFSSPTCPIL